MARYFISDDAKAIYKISEGHAYYCNEQIKEWVENKDCFRVANSPEFDCISEEVARGIFKKWGAEWK